MSPINKSSRNTVIMRHCLLHMSWLDTSGSNVDRILNHKTLMLEESKHLFKKNHKILIFTPLAEFQSIKTFLYYYTYSYHCTMHFYLWVTKIETPLSFKSCFFYFPLLEQYCHHIIVIFLQLPLKSIIQIKHSYFLKTSWLTNQLQKTPYCFGFLPKQVAVLLLWLFPISEQAQ